MTEWIVRVSRVVGRREGCPNRSRMPSPRIGAAWSARVIPDKHDGGICYERIRLTHWAFGYVAHCISALPFRVRRTLEDLHALNVRLQESGLVVRIRTGRIGRLGIIERRPPNLVRPCPGKRRRVLICTELVSRSVRAEA